MTRRKTTDPWALARNAVDRLRELIPPGSTVVELGSGTGTAYLTAFFDVVTVEHDPRYMGLAPKARYIHAPLVHDWYDRDVLERELPETHHALIIDGPPRELRAGILTNTDLFDWSVPVIVDDTDRALDRQVAEKLATRFGPREIRTYETDGAKRFSVLMP